MTDRISATSLLPDKQQGLRLEGDAIMSFKLTKDDIKRREEIRDALTAAEATLEEALDAYNASLNAANERLREHVDAFNGHLGELREFATDIALEAESNISEMSDRWRQSDRGERAQSWELEWEVAARVEDLYVQLPDELAIYRPEWESALDTDESAE